MKRRKGEGVQRVRGEERGRGGERRGGDGEGVRKGEEEKRRGSWQCGPGSANTLIVNILQFA